MDLTPYLNLLVEFDLTAYPKVVLTDASNYPAGVAEAVKGYFKIKQPDGITLVEGSFNTPNISWNGSALNVYEKNLRLKNNKHQCGEYVMEYHVLHDGNESVITRTIDFTYKEATLKLVEDFDVFTPQLIYKDQTNYAQTGYEILDTSVEWTAIIGTVGTKTGSADIFDLAYGGLYYDAAYDITFVRNISFIHSTYSWLTVKDLYTESIETSANTPKPVDQLLTYLTDLKNQLSAASCDHGDVLKKRYMYAESVFTHFKYLLCATDKTGIEDLLKEFITLTHNDTLPAYVNTNTPIQPYDYVCPGSGVGSGNGWLPYNVTMIAEMAQWDTGLPDGVVFQQIDLDGIGRKFIQGPITDDPAEGTFLYDPTTKKMKYNPIINQGQWIRAWYIIQS